jgi:tetratricopeptide (TPR) repeat protein
MTGVLIAAAIIAVPALAFTLWPLVRRGRGRALLAFPPDPREQLTEQKRAALRALRELEFEHAAGHVGDEDHAELRARYEAETAAILDELDRLGALAPEPPRRDRTRVEEARRSAWQQPLALAAAGAFLVVFGVGIGVGIVRYTAPDDTSTAMAGAPPPGGPGAMMPGGGDRPAGGDASAPAGSAATPAAGGSTQGTLSPGVLQGMLSAAREALFAGRYSDALAAYQAILKRDPNNADALAHVGLMAAMADHPDKALELIDKALTVDPKFPPALMFRGQVLYEAKRDVPGAIKAWEQFLAVAPAGEDRQRVTKLLAEAKSRGAAPPR